MMEEDDDFFNVYMITSLGMPRNHEAVFVETHHPEKEKEKDSSSGKGYIFQVSGNIQQGMYHNHHAGTKPEEDKTSVFVSKEFLGRVARRDFHEGRFRRVCDGVEAPLKQFDGHKRLFPGVRLRRCGEWAREVVKKLREENILVV